MIETLVSAIIILLVCGMLIWCVERIPGIPQPVLIAIQIVIVLICALFLLDHAGIVSGGPYLRG